MNKIVEDIRRAVSDVPDGATVLIGGFGGAGTPHNLVHALIERGARDLTLVANSAVQWWPLVERGQVRRVIAGFTGDPRRPSVTRTINKLVAEGRLQMETVPHGTLEERLRAGGMGIAAFYTAAGIGTEVEAGKEKRLLDGRPYLLECALRADFALIKGWKADRWANVACRLGAGNRNVIMATAAKTTIAEVEAIVPLGDLDPNRIAIPGIFVHRVVQAPKVAWWPQLEPEMLERRATWADRALKGLTRELMALRAAQELADGMYVNLGYGLPTLVSNFLPSDREIVLHAEQGTLGYGPIVAEEERWDVDMINASGHPVTLVPGACFCDLATSFGMIRGHHLDVSILGAYQVSAQGDLANWRRPEDSVGGIGGAMELATGAKRIIALMEHTGPRGEYRIVRDCSFPITARRAVHTIITNLACLDVTAAGLLLREVAPGVTPEEVQAATEPPLLIPPDIREMVL